MEFKDGKQRCSWVSKNNVEYIKYHDLQWGRPITDERELFEVLSLELFQSGLSFQCIFDKRENFRSSFDNFEPCAIMNYNESKVSSLLSNEKIVRHEGKIRATICNAAIFLKIQKEFGSFLSYLRTFCGDKIIYEIGKSSSALSDAISKDLKKRGMKFLGSKTVYAYLQAIGIIYSHEKGCFLEYKK